MIVKKMPIDFEERYTANDGKIWRTQIECEQYEELLADPSPLKNLSFFDSDGNPIDVFQLKDIPAFSYLVLTNGVKRYQPTVVKAIIGDPYDSGMPSYALPTERGIWYNDWSNAYEGAYGPNGWVRKSTIKDLQKQIEHCQEEIEKLQKIANRG